MPYIKDADFARLEELIQLIKEFAEREKHPSVFSITERMLKIMEEYRGHAESHSSPQRPSVRKQP